MQPSGSADRPGSRRSERATAASHGAYAGARARHGTSHAYHFHLAEDLPEDVLAALFGELRRLEPARDGAVLVGTAGDPEELAGIMARLSLLGCTVIGVHRIVANGDGAGDGQPR